MIHHNSDLVYDIYNITNEHNQRQTHYFSSILYNFGIYFLVNQKNYFVTSSTSSLIMIFILFLFECITCSSSLSMEEIKLFNLNMV